MPFCCRQPSASQTSTVSPTFLICYAARVASHLFFTLVGLAFVFWTGFLFAKALTTGTVTWGKECFSRKANPGDFYFVLGLFGLIATALVATFVYEYRFGDAPSWPISVIVVGGVTARALVASLRSGEALDPAFSRREEPLQYWGLIAFLIAVLLATAWSVLDMLVD